MADELLEALAKRQRESDAAAPPIPLDDFAGDAGDALLDDMFAQLDQKSAAPAEEAVPDNVTALPTRRAGLFAGVGILVAAAAALVLWLAMPSAQPPLPGYDIVSLAGGAAAVRGDADTVPDVIKLESPTDPIKWRFAPATPVEGEVELAVVLSARLANGDRVFAAVPNPTVSPSGSVELLGPLDSFIELGEGHWTVEVLFVRPGDAPSSADEANDERWPRQAIKVIIDAP